MLPETFVPEFSDKMNEVLKMKYQDFGSTGLKMSFLSLGAGGFGGTHTYGEYDHEKAVETVITALKYGINFIDAGPHYGLGRAEKFFGEVLKGIPRNAYYISTKVGRCGAYFNFSAEAIRESFEQSLSRLQLEYVDIVFVHDVEFADSLDIILNTALPEVEKIVQSGKAKYIGISGYPLSVLWDVVEKSYVRIDCILTYCRDTLIDNTLQHYIDKFQNKGIAVINAGCLAMRLLTNSGPPAWHPALQATKDLCRNAAILCQENGVELGRLALYHTLNQPGSTTCLIGMNNPAELRLNLDVFTNGLNEQEKKLLEEIRKRYFLPNVIHQWEGIEVDLYRKNLMNNVQ